MAGPNASSAGHHALSNSLNGNLNNGGLSNNLASNLPSHLHTPLNNHLNTNGLNHFSGESPSPHYSNLTNLNKTSSFLSPSSSFHEHQTKIAKASHERLSHSSVYMMNENVLSNSQNLPNGVQNLVSNHQNLLNGQTVNGDPPKHSQQNGDRPPKPNYWSIYGGSASFAGDLCNLSASRLGNSPNDRPCNEVADRPGNHLNAGPTGDPSLDNGILKTSPLTGSPLGSLNPSSGLQLIH